MHDIFNCKKFFFTNLRHFLNTFRLRAVQHRKKPLHHNHIIERTPEKRIHLLVAGCRDLGVVVCRLGVVVFTVIGNFAAVASQFRVARRAHPDRIVQLFGGQGRAVFWAVGAEDPPATPAKFALQKSMQFDEILN